MGLQEFYLLNESIYGVLYLIIFYKQTYFSTYSMNIQVLYVCKITIIENRSLLFYIINNNKICFYVLISF